MSDLSDLIRITRVMIGTGTFLFLGSACVGAGLHTGLRIGAKWFGPIKITRINYGFRSSSDGEEA